MDIKGKVAVVSGGASGMGLEIVKRLVSLGAKAAIFECMTLYPCSIP